MTDVNKVLEEADNGNKVKVLSQNPKRENVRGLLAYIFIACFFACIFTVFLIGYNSCFSTDQYKDLLLIISSILSGPLGIVLAFYFKDHLDRKEN